MSDRDAEKRDAEQRDAEKFDPYSILRPVPTFTLTSTDVTDGQPLQDHQFGEDFGGTDTSPQLSWRGFPPETRSFAVTAYDPDAPTGSGFWHWAVFNIPASVTSLDAGAGSPGSGLLPEGAIILPNEARKKAYIGAGPPSGTGVHRYYFVVYAVDLPALEVDPEATPAILGFNLNFHALARATLVGTGEFGHDR